jgi:hypothetical protein
MKPIGSSKQPSPRKGGQEIDEDEKGEKTPIYIIYLHNIYNINLILFYYVEDYYYYYYILFFY